MNPPRFPNRAIWRELSTYKTFFYLSLKFLIKIPLNKKLSLLSQALGSVPPFSPKAGPLWKQIFISSALLSMFSGSPVKEPPLQVPLTELPQREIPHS